MLGCRKIVSWEGMGEKRNVCIGEEEVQQGMQFLGCGPEAFISLQRNTGAIITFINTLFRSL
jgi:hypothetical protein